MRFLDCYNNNIGLFYKDIEIYADYYARKPKRIKRTRELCIPGEHKHRKN